MTDRGELSMDLCIVIWEYYTKFRIHALPNHRRNVWIASRINVNCVVSEQLKTKTSHILHYLSEHIGVELLIYNSDDSGGNSCFILSSKMQIKTRK
ncbi:hypothetical protein CEXT_277441 [Caerostris extrusa]|uniref:Uncharacterized protein n=1 Tax=Caerostris extrusa TaxID=172846 RepID=A0AAV4S107_CAEEX|nr:hypothetical protein CEXT_277441 [Caerostris extrusa]